jgi:alpha-D-ribose 1-methylphosphonate 5-triphosphate diphosphatase PhnM
VTRVVIALVIVAAAAAVAWYVRRRRVPDAPTQRRYSVPEQLDRADFARQDAPWLVAVFTSATCDLCADVTAKATVLESDDVAVAIAEFGSARDLHARYHIEAVPMVVIVDSDGVTRGSFLGPVSATDLWAAVAELREPGSTPGSCEHHAR